MNDMQLLRNFREEESQPAFAQIMDRHYSFVFSTCLRELGNRPQAEDAAQVVFLLLSKKAGSIRETDTLVGWLFQTARWTCRDFRKHEQRRLERERKAFNEMQSDQASDMWAEMEPHVNDALSCLNPVDRQAVLLRFFEGMTMARTGEALGVSEAAAKMRVSRALDKLRTYFSRHQIQLESNVLVALLSTHACTDPSASAAVIAAPTSHALQVTEGIVKKMAMTKLTIAAAIVAAGSLSTVAVSQAIHPITPIQQVITLPGGQPTAGATVKFHLPPQKPALATLVGKVRMPGTSPAAGIRIVAQIQNSNINGLSPDKYGATWAEALTNKDGAYKLTGLIEVPYNVTVDPRPNGPWVTSAAEGVVAKQTGTARVPDLILTHGSVVTGIVTDQNTGVAVANVPIGCYGPDTPASSAMIQMTYTDKTGHYKLRVAPGRNRVYIAIDNAPDSATVIMPKSGGSTVNLQFDAIKLVAEMKASALTRP